MRYILFRGKTVSNNEWVYGYYVKTNFNWNRFGIHNDWIIERSVSNGGRFAVIKRSAVKNETIGQYIGHDDIHRNKIFEGDVVKVHDLMPGISDESRDFEGIVYYRNGSFFIENQYELHYRWMDYQVEVLGNKYDNPELLKMFAVDPRHSRIDGD